MKHFSLSKRSMSYLRWLLITLFFFVVTWIYMGPSFTHMGSAVLNTPGDHTAGIMYNTWVHPSGPMQGFSGYTNYPFGEQLWQPLALSSIVPSTLHVIFSEATNIIAGWNLLVFLAFMSSALVMYAFIAWLTKNTWIAIFGGYAVTFLPYHVFASWGQIAGLLGVVFVIALWRAIIWWREPRKLNSLWFVVPIGVGFYTDGYFVLMGLVMLLTLWLTCFGYYILTKKLSLKIMAKHLQGLAMITTLSAILLLPLVWVNHHYAAQIDSIFNNARGDIVQDAHIFSALPSMYLQPKSLIFVGFTVFLLALFGVVMLFNRYKRSTDKELLFGDQILFVGWLSLVLSFVAFWFSLRPTGYIAGLKIHNPSEIIIRITSSWRVFGRLQMLVVIGLVTLACLALFWLVRKNKRQGQWLVFASILLLVIEFGIVKPRPAAQSFDYNDAPSVYSWLRNNDSIKAIAEYPLDEPPQGFYLSDYYTFQEISKKPILNTLRPNSPEAALRRSIAGINDPQTLPVLRSLGIGMVNVRPIPSEAGDLDISRAALRNTGLEKRFSNGRFSVDSFSLRSGPAAEYALTIPTIQYFQVDIDRNGHALYKVDDNATLKLFALPGASNNEQTVSFNISADSSRAATIIQNGRVLWSGMLTTDSKNVLLRNVSPAHDFTINNEKSAQLTHINISNLQVVR